MNTALKHYCLLIISMALILSVITACQNDDKGNTPSMDMTSREKSEADVEELLASLNMHHFSEPVKAPEFELSSVNGGTVSLSQYRGRVVLLSFWATW